MIAVLVVLICCVKSKQKRGSNKVIIDPSHPNEQTERNLVQLSPIKGIIIDDEAVPEEVKISEKSLEISSQKEVQPDINESNYASNHTEGNLKTIAPESKEEIASEEKAPRKQFIMQDLVDENGNFVPEAQPKEVQTTKASK